MATRIARDVGSPVNLTDPHTLAEYEGFAADVPNTDGMIAAANNIQAEGNTPANAVRAASLMREGFLDGLGVGDDLPTPDVVGATAPLIERQGLRDYTLNVPRVGGGSYAVNVWSFRDRVSGAINWPAAPIRVREGRTIHTEMGSATGPHTIHHHGIEPTPMNDGVGHLTFEVGGGAYVYQWVAAEAGTYFYHCHRNTTLHFERGMYGALIIDPDVPGAPFVTGGPGQTWVANTLTPYDAEAIWVVDDVDSRWHGLTGINYGAGRNAIDDHNAGLQDIGPGKFGDAVNPFTLITDLDNPRLHDFDPNMFVVTGPGGHVAVPVDPTLRAVLPGQVAIPRAIDNHQLTQVGVTVAAGAKILVRTLNAAYCHTRWSFPTALSGQVIAADGRTFGREPWGERYSSPFTLASINHQFQLSVARRWDVLLDTAGVTPGTYDVAVSLFTSIGDDRLVTIRLPITIS